HVDLVAAAIRFPADVERLMQVDDEMHEEAQRLGALRRIARLGEPRRVPLDGPPDVAFRRVTVRLERLVVADVHVVPRRGMPPRVVGPYAIRPRPDLREPPTVRKRRDLGGRARTKERLGGDARDAVTGRPEGL